MVARFLYRILRMANLFGTVEESKIRDVMRNTGMRNTSFMAQFNRLVVAELSKPLSYVAPLTGYAMAPALNAGVLHMNETRDMVCISTCCRCHRKY